MPIRKTIFAQFHVVESRSTSHMVWQIIEHFQESVVAYNNDSPCTQTNKQTGTSRAVSCENVGLVGDDLSLLNYSSE